MAPCRIDHSDFEELNGNYFMLNGVAVENINLLHIFSFYIFSIPIHWIAFQVKDNDYKSWFILYWNETCWLISTFTWIDFAYFLNKVVIKACNYGATYWNHEVLVQALDKSIDSSNSWALTRKTTKSSEILHLLYGWILIQHL